MGITDGFVDVAGAAIQDPIFQVESHPSRNRPESDPTGEAAFFQDLQYYQDRFAVAGRTTNRHLLFADHRQRAAVRQNERGRGLAVAVVIM